MFWMLRAAWGCLFTAYLLGNDREAYRHLVGNNLDAGMALILLVGFGPALLPLTRWKAVGFVWAVVSSFGMLGEGKSGPLAYLLVCWGPMLIPSALRRFKEAGSGSTFSAKHSVLRDEAGRKADWTFKGDGIEVAVDLARRELRVRARDARSVDADFTSTRGVATFVRPLFECSVEFSKVMKTEHHGTVGYAYGTSMSGEQVRMTVPKEGYSTEHFTGRYLFEVTHSPRPWTITGDFASRAADGSVQYHGKFNEGLGKHMGGIKLSELSIADSARLRDEWAKVAEPLIAKAKAAFAAEKVAERRAAKTDEYLRDESATRERRAREAEEQRERERRGTDAAAKRLGDLRATRGVDDAFKDLSHDIDGVYSWAIVAGRDGQAAVISGAESWAGSLAGASAWIDVVAKGEGKDLDTLELVIQVADAEYERERLAKRRLKIMRGGPKDALMAWGDRVQMLSAAAAKHAPTVAEGPAPAS